MPSTLAGNPPIQTAIDAGVVPPLVALLGLDDASPGLLVRCRRISLFALHAWGADGCAGCVLLRRLQLNAAWALSNIAAGTPDQARVVVDCGAVPRFVALLNITPMPACVPRPSLQSTPHTPRSVRSTAAASGGGGAAAAAAC